MVRAQNAQTPKPLELGAKLLCKWRDVEVKPCEVLERQQNEETNEWEYCAPLGPARATCPYYDEAMNPDSPSQMFITKE